MTLNQQQPAIRHSVRKDRAFSDDAYRSALGQKCGVTRLAALDYDGFLAMTGFFDCGGCKPADAKGARRASMGHGILCPDQADPGSVTRRHPQGL